MKRGKAYICTNPLPREDYCTICNKQKSVTIWKIPKDPLKEARLKLCHSCLNQPVE